MNKGIGTGGLFIGCMFLGIGLGLVFDEVAGGVLIGMGVGFVLSAVFHSLRRD